MIENYNAFRIFLSGGQPQLRNVYNEVSFPVSRGTKMISSMVKWDHSASWLTFAHKNQDYCGKEIIVNVQDPEYNHLIGHEIDGKILMPAASYLVSLSVV